MSTTLALPEMLTEQQAADLLNVKPQTLTNWRCTGRVELPFVKFGKLVRYKREALEAFIERQTVNSAA